MIGDYDNRIGRPCSTNSSFTRRDVFQSKWVISQSEDEKTMAKPCEAIFKSVKPVKSHYSLGICYIADIAIENGPVEIVDFLIKNCHFQ